MIDRRESKRFHFQTPSPSETEVFGAALGERLDRAVCISLVGALGSGKSVLARAICRGLGVDELVVSPSFTLCEEYVGRMPVIHLDLYRLDHEREIQELGVFDRLDDAVILAEWGDRSRYLTDAAEMVIHLEVTGDSTRAIRVACDAAWTASLEGLFP
jgi:tRNA threonylcarbamoyladenosine biosynthesis protein TsaE